MVSGASRGIGEAIARRLLDDGYRVSAGVRDVDATRSLFADAPADRLVVARFDSADPETAAGWLDATLDAFGPPHALVNNAGIWRQVNFETGTEEDLDAQWETNVKAPFRITRLALPHLKACGTGRIVNIASTDGVRFPRQHLLDRLHDVEARTGRDESRREAVRLRGWRARHGAVSGRGRHGARRREYPA